MIENFSSGLPRPQRRRRPDPRPTATCRSSTSAASTRPPTTAATPTDSRDRRPAQTVFGPASHWFVRWRTYLSPCSPWSRPTGSPASLAKQASDRRPAEVLAYSCAAIGLLSRRSWTSCSRSPCSAGRNWARVCADERVRLITAASASSPRVGQRRPAGRTRRACRLSAPASWSCSRSRATGPRVRHPTRGGQPRMTRPRRSADRRAVALLAVGLVAAPALRQLPPRLGPPRLHRHGRGRQRARGPGPAERHPAARHRRGLRRPRRLAAAVGPCRAAPRRVAGGGRLGTVVFAVGAAIAAFVPTPCGPGRRLRRAAPAGPDWASTTPAASSPTPRSTSASAPHGSRPGRRSALVPPHRLVAVLARRRGLQHRLRVLQPAPRPGLGGRCRPARPHLSASARGSSRSRCYAATVGAACPARSPSRPAGARL